MLYPAPVEPAGGWPTDGRNATSRPTLDIQRFLIGAGFLAEGQADGSYGRVTSKGAAAYQQTRWLESDGVWGLTTDGMAFPPAGSIHGVDYSFARPQPKMLAARGVRFAARYLASTANAKGLTRSEYDSLRAAGLEVPLIYEEDGKELRLGFAAGVRVAKLAEEHRLRVGLGPQPIHFNSDYDVPAAEMSATLDALRGVASVIGLARTGYYAGFGPIKAAFDAGVITHGFQTYAWSNGQWDPRAQLQQWSNGQWGDSVDFTRAVAEDYGQKEIA